MKWESSLVEHLQWSDTITNRESKEQLARMIAMRVQEGEIIGAGSGSVSYTHLRDHETRRHLVCRLLLEKNDTATTEIYTILFVGSVRCV